MHLANAHAILPQNAKLLMGSTSIRLAEQVPGATGRDAREMAPASSLLLLFFFLFFFLGLTSALGMISRQTKCRFDSAWAQDRPQKATKSAQLSPPIKIEFLAIWS